MDQPYQRKQQSTVVRINNPDYFSTMPISNPTSSITTNIDNVNLNLMDPSNKNTNLNPYLVVNHPVPFGGNSVPTVSKTLSLPRVLSNGFSGGGTKKRNSKSFVDAEQPVVNPAFTDGLVRPVAISDYDDPLRFIQLPPPPNFKPEVVNIKTNQQLNSEQPQPSQIGQVTSSNTKSIPSFRLTRNVSSTLSKVTGPIEFRTLPRQFQTQTDQVNPRNSSQMDIPLSSFHLRDKQSIDAQSSENGELAQQRLSTASTVSNQSSDASSGNPSTTSSLYYVDCRRQSQQEKAHQRSSDRSTSMSSASSTITGSSGSSSDGHPTTTTIETINQNDEFDEEDLPPPPDTLLRSDDEENGNSGQQTFGQRPQHQPNKSTPTINNSSNKLITQLLPPLPPSDYHSITTLQRRKQQQQQQQQQHNSNYHQPQQLQKVNASQVNGDVPAYSTTTLRSFQSAGANSRSGTLRKPPPPPPPPRPQPGANNLAGFDGCSSTASTTYADPSSISIGSSSPIVDNLTMSTQPTPSPTSDPLDQHPSSDAIINHSYAQQRSSMHQTKTLFNRNSSPTYGWVYHQPDSVIRYDSSSLGDSGGSGGQPNSLESGDSRQPLSHSFDTNNNDNNNSQRRNNNFHVYRNQVFTQDETRIQDEDDGHQTKARYVDGPYKMFYDSPDDQQSGLNGNNPTNGHDPKNKKKKKNSPEVRTTGRKDGCFRGCCRSLVIITTIALLIFMLVILGTTLYYRFVLNRPETGFSAIQQMQKYLFGEEKVISGSNSTATTPTVFTSISAAVTLFSSTFTTPSMAKSKPLIPTTPSLPSSSLETRTTETLGSTILSSTTINLDETSTTATTDRPIISETTTPALTSTTNEESSPEITVPDEDETATSDDSEPAETTVQPLINKLIPAVKKIMLTTEPPPATIEYEDETLEGFVVHKGSSTEEPSSSSTTSTDVT